MSSANLLKFLVCPENRSPLVAADERLLGEMNATASAGLLKNRAGRPVAYPLEAALVRADRTVAYPVVDRIPLMLVDEGIPLAQLGAKGSASPGAGPKS